VGRAILNDHLPKAVPVNLSMPYINGLLKKKGVGQLVNYCYLRFGLETTVKMLDEHQTARLQLCHEGRPFHRHRRHGHPGWQEDPGKGRREAGD
jgi:hypothetical protein